MRSLRAIALCAVAFTFALGAAQAPAQAYPNKPIRLVIAFPPGGTSDFVGRVIADRMSQFLGQPMQLKVNFLCKDSILAAPLAIEIARCLDLAQQRGQGGIQEHLSVFFKMPMGETEQAFHKQEEAFLEWLG